MSTKHPKSKKSKKSDNSKSKSSTKTRKNKKEYYESFIKEAEEFILENATKIKDGERKALWKSDQNVNLDPTELPHRKVAVSEPLVTDELLNLTPPTAFTGVDHVSDKPNDELEKVINGINHTHLMLKKKNDMYQSLQERFILDQNEVRGQMQECEKIVRKFEKRVIKYKQRLAESRGELSKKNTSILSLQRKITNLKSRRSTEKDDLKKRIEHKERVLRRKQSEIEKVRVRSEFIEEQLRKLETEKERLVKDMKKKEYSLEETFNEIDMGLISAGIDVTKLESRKKKIEVISKGLKVGRQKAVEVEVLKSRVQEQEQQLKKDEDLKSKLDHVDHLDKSIRKKDRIIQSMRRREKTRVTQVLELSEKVSNLSRDVLDKENEIENMREEQSRSLVLSSHQIGELEDKDRYIVELARENREIKDNLDSTSNRMELYKKKGLDLKNLIGRIYKEYVSKKKEIKILTNQLEKLSKKYRFTQNVLIVFILIVAFFFAIHSVEFL